MVDHDGEFQFDHTIKSVSIAPMLVSLFLVLLTIFVVLNTVSRIDKPKFARVAKDVTQTFNIKPQIEPDTKANEQGGAGEAAAQFFSDMEGWAQTVISIKGVKPVRKGNDILIRIPANQIFENEKTTFALGGERKMRTLARMLYGWVQHFRLTAEIVMEMRIFGTPEDATFEALSIKRASLLAENFTKEQVNESYLSPGVRKTQQADADYIYFRFTLYSPKTLLPGVSLPQKNTAKGG